MKVSKGQHGYINHRKKAQLTKTLIMFLVAAAIFVLGLALNNWEKSNVFTIVAALAVLPAAKMLVNFIVLAPYHSVSDETYQKLKSDTAKEDIVYSDIVMTSEEKVMNLAMLVVTGDQAYGLIGRKKENRAYIETYLNKGFQARCYDVKFKILEDEKEFIRQVKNAKRIDMEESKQDAWKEYLESLMV